MRLYEITATVTYATVIAACSEEDALAHVKTWERAWADPANADLLSVCDIGVRDVRDMTRSGWEDEAHDITDAANEA